MASEPYPEGRGSVGGSSASAGGSSGALPLVIAILAVLLLVLAAPYLARQIAYSIALGQQQAQAKVAVELLSKFPKQADRAPVVAKIIEPCVVGIETRSVVQDDEDFRPGQQEVAVTEGSGVIVDPQGYIITNAHVVSQATSGRVTVKLSDGRKLRNGRVIGADPVTDLAIVKVDAGHLTAARLGDSDQLQVGDPVLAVGSPYGLAETVTSGIISAKNRRLGIERVGYRDFLQTDAAINPGNSGGPLVNMSGQVIGINTAIVGKANQGIGFAIPSNLVNKVEGLLRSTGISRGWIGVGVQNLTAALARQFGLSDTRGALVAEVAPDSPAAKAGLRPGDVIVHWDKEPIDNSNDLRIAVAGTKPETTVKMQIVRDGKPRELSITTAERPNQTTQ